MENKIYIAYIGGGCYDDSWDRIVATFENLEDAETWCDEHYGVLPDYREMREAYEEWYDEFYDSFDNFEDADEIDDYEEFIKTHPEYTMDQMTDMDDIKYNPPTIMHISELVLGAPANERQVASKYIVNPNEELVNYSDWEWINY